MQVGAVKSILSLLAHENLDISIATVELLQELTDTDALEDEEDNATAMIECLVRSPGPAVASACYYAYDARLSARWRAFWGIF